MQKPLVWSLQARTLRQMTEAVDREQHKVESRVLIVTSPEILDWNSSCTTSADNCVQFCCWRFGSVADRALRVSRFTGDLAAPIREWLKLLDGKDYFQSALRELQISPGQDRMTLPFQLMAIVNRADFAQVKNGKLSGAEIRLIYGGTKADDWLRLIIEFVLPEMDKTAFQEYLQSWWNLQELATGAPDFAYQKALQSLLAKFTAQSEHVRIRANGKLQENNWRFAQFAVGAKGIAPIDLDSQYDVSPGQCLSNGKLFELVRDNEAAILAGESVTDSKLFVRFAEIQKLNEQALGFAPAVSSSTQADDLRFIVSMNSCTGCHHQDAPTVDRTHQVGLRRNKGESELSPFLRGGTFNGPQLAGCAPKKQREFSDLKRRHLFVRTVLFELKPSDSDSVWNEKLAKTGLMAFQPH